MSLTISAYCPFCRKHNAFTPAAMKVLSDRSRHPQEVAHLVGDRDAVAVHIDEHGGRWWIAKCHSCTSSLLVEGQGVTIYPNTLPGPVEEAIPAPMRRDLV